MTSNLPPSTLTVSVLTALVVGSMIGSGIFNLPQNMAASAGAAAILISWFIAGAGMLFLCFTFQTLALKKPQLNNGVYAYARASAGEFIGFNSAWGYWLSAWLGNVSFLIAIGGALGYFFPVFGPGNTKIAILTASILLWILHFFILKGIKGAAILNAIITLAKLIPLILFIIVVIPAFKFHLVKLNLWGHTAFFAQIKNSMLVTVWVFIGIEGASVYSARAKKRSDIGKATFLGFIITLSLLMSVSLLALGIFSQVKLASFTNLSMASILEHVIGRPGAIIMVLGLLLSAGGALLAWTLLAAESLFIPAKDGLLPSFFAKENKKGVPANTLWLTTGLTQLFLLLILYAKATYLALITLTSSMILIPYFFSALYLTQIACQEIKKKSDYPFYSKYKDIFIGFGATCYCLWLLYAAGVKYLFLSALLYIPGSIFFIIAKKQLKQVIFNSFEKIILGIIVGLAILASYLLYLHQISI